VFDSFFSDPERGTGTMIIWTIIYYSAHWFYRILFHRHYGQTVGKMVTHIKVLNFSESGLPTLLQAIIRESNAIVFNTLLLGWVIYLLVTHQYIDRAQTMMQNPGMLISSMSFGWLLLEMITMMTSRKRRAFHDLIAGTVVVATLDE
jgi:uncharacterized RDD family membrane protein YckC